MGGRFIKNNIKRIAFSVIGGLFLSLVFYNIVKAIPPFSPYLPGETLNPACSPGDPNCTVLPSLIGTSTPGNISFYTGTTTLSGNTELFWDNINKRLGIGTSTPAEKLHVIGNILGIGNLIISGTATTTNFNVTGLTSLATTTISTQLGVPLITTSAGNLTINPAGNLIISKPTSISGDLTVSNTATTTQLFVTSTSTLGTIISGTWQGSVISTQYGGTGLSSIGTANQILGVNTGGTGLEYKNIASLLTAGTGISISGTTNATIANTGILSLTAGSGISISTGQNPTIANLGVLSLNSATGTLTLQGTTNQVNVSTVGSTITISTPQNIHTGATPTFNSLTLSSLTPGSVLFAGTGGTISQNNSKFFWDNTNLRLGIGTATPGETLDINGNARLIKSGTATSLIQYPSFDLKLQASSWDTTLNGGAGGESVNNFVLRNIGLSGFGPDYRLGFINNVGTEVVSIKGSGNVGIGTTTPAYPLHVVNPSSNIPAFFDSAIGNTRVVINSAANTGFGLSIGNVLQWSNSVYQQTGTGANFDYAFWNEQLNTPALFMDGDTNNVGIGTTTPTGTFHVANASSSAAFVVASNGNIGIGTAAPVSKLHIHGNYSNNGTGGFMLDATDDTNPEKYVLRINPYVVTFGGVGYIFQTKSLLGGTQTPLVFDNVGNVGIGMTFPGSRLQIQGSTSDNTASSLNVTNSAGKSLLYVRNDGNIGIGTTTPAGTFHVSNASSSAAFVVTSNGNIGIGTAAPIYKLDVAGSIRAQTSLTAGINVATLLGNQTLTPGTDKMYQYLNPNGADRVITLSTTTANVGDKFIIRNNDTSGSGNKLQINQGATILDNIFAQSIREYIFDGTNWVSGDVGTGISTDLNVAIGYNANGSSNGAAVGYNANGVSSGAAVGYNANGGASGAALGNNANGGISGAAVGASANGAFGGAAVGNSAQAQGFGAAVGNSANGSTNGAAVGASAKGLRFGAALGYNAGFNIDTTADRYNVLVGAYSGYQLTTGIGNIILGYQSGYDTTFSPTTGSKNILIGFQAGTPATTTSNFLNIGNLIFATGVNTATGTAISTGNIGIGTTTPGYKLDVQGSIRQTNAVNCALNSDANGAIICTVSSQRYKTNIQDLNFDINKFLTLNPKSFDWNTSTINFAPGEKGSIGFIAEEVSEVFPEIVRYKDGQPEGIKYEILPVYLFKIVKDLILGFTDKVKASLNELGIIIENGITKIKEIFTEKITTKKLCLEGDDGETICLDKNQVKELLNRSGSSYTTVINNNQNSSNTNNLTTMTNNNELNTNTTTNTNETNVNNGTESNLNSTTNTSTSEENTTSTRESNSNNNSQELVSNWNQSASENTTSTNTTTSSQTSSSNGNQDSSTESTTSSNETQQ